MNYKYCDDNLSQGNFTGKISEGFWNTLNKQLENAEFRTIDSNTDMHIYDAEYFELIIHWKNSKKRIVRLSSAKHDPILKTCIWLNDSYKKIKLKPTNDPIEFEGEFQKRTRPPIKKDKVNR